MGKFDGIDIKAAVADAALDEQKSIKDKKQTSPNPNGRPKKKKEDLTNVQVVVRFTENQNKKLDTVAASLGISKAALIKSRLADIISY